MFRRHGDNTSDHRTGQARGSRQRDEPTHHDLEMNMTMASVGSGQRGSGLPGVPFLSRSCTWPHSPQTSGRDTHVDQRDITPAVLEAGLSALV